MHPRDPCDSTFKLHVHLLPWNAMSTSICSTLWSTSLKLFASRMRWWPEGLQVARPGPVRGDHTSCLWHHFPLLLLIRRWRWLLALWRSGLRLRSSPPLLPPRTEPRGGLPRSLSLPPPPRKP
jgi:hypothetical protein